MAPVDPLHRARELLQEGIEAYGRGELNIALETWRRALMFDPSNPEAQRLVSYAEECLSSGAVDARRTTSALPFLRDRTESGIAPPGFGAQLPNEPQVPGRARQNTLLSTIPSLLAPSTRLAPQNEGVTNGQGPGQRNRALGDPEQGDPVWGESSQRIEDGGTSDKQAAKEPVRMARAQGERTPLPAPSYDPEALMGVDLEQTLRVPGALSVQPVPGASPMRTMAATDISEEYEELHSRELVALATEGLASGSGSDADPVTPPVQALGRSDALLTRPYEAPLAPAVPSAPAIPRSIGADETRRVSSQTAAKAAADAAAAAAEGWKEGREDTDVDRLPAESLAEGRGPVASGGSTPPAGSMSPEGSMPPGGSMSLAGSQDLALAQARQTAQSLVAACRTAFDNNDIPSAAQAADAALIESERAPLPGIADVIEPARELFETVFSCHVGGDDGVPQLAADVSAMKSGFDHRMGFLLSCIDGSLPVHTLLEISGLSRVECTRTLSRLLTNQIITI